jgi:hypothetical protein
MDLIQPKEIEINGKTYRISKFPATVGREIVAKYPVSNMPKLGDYKVSEEVMIKLMNYVEVVLPERSIRLSTRELIDNHVPDWEVLAKLEWEMLQYNCSFLTDGKSLSFLEKLARLAEQKISEILTASLGKSSVREKQH